MNEWRRDDEKRGGEKTGYGAWLWKSESERAERELKSRFRSWWKKGRGGKMENNKPRERGSVCEKGGALIFLVQRSTTAERLQHEVHGSTCLTASNPISSFLLRNQLSHACRPPPPHPTTTRDAARCCQHPTAFSQWGDGPTCGAWRPNSRRSRCWPEEIGSENRWLECKRMWRAVNYMAAASATHNLLWGSANEGRRKWWTVARDRGQDLTFAVEPLSPPVLDSSGWSFTSQQGKIRARTRAVKMFTVCQCWWFQPYSTARFERKHVNALASASSFIYKILSNIIHP